MMAVEFLGNITKYRRGGGGHTNNNNYQSVLVISLPLGVVVWRKTEREKSERTVVAWTAVVVLNRCSSCHRRYRAGWRHGRRAWNRLAARRNNRPDRCFTVLPPPALPRHGAPVRPAGHWRRWRLWLIVMTSKIVTRNGRRWRIRLGLPTYIYITLSRPNLGNIIYMEDDFFFYLVYLYLNIYLGTRRTYTNRTKENQKESAASTTRYILYNILIITLYPRSAGRRAMRWLHDSNNNMTTIGRKF